MTIYYVYHHSYDYVPMHASDVIEELVRAGVYVHVFTGVNPHLLRDCDWSRRVPVTNFHIIRRRIWERLSYAIQLIILLPTWCLLRRPSIIYERASMMTVLTAVIAGILRIPLVTEINGIQLEELQLEGAGKRRMAFVKWYEKFILGRSRLVIAVNEDIKNWLARTYGCDEARLRTIFNGTNTRRYAPASAIESRRTLGLETDSRFYVGYLGTLTPWCGIDLLTASAPQILSKYPHVRFIVGGGEEPYFTRYKQNVSECGLDDAFRFFGQIAWKDGAGFISAFDVALVSVAPPPVRFSPLKLYAYLACGRPVIGSDIGEISSLCAQGVGLTFKPRNPDSLANAIIYAIEHPEQLSVMGDKARRIIVEQHSWEIRVRQLLGYLNDIQS